MKIGGFEIIELAYVHKVIEEDKSHFWEVSYLVDIYGNETVLKVHPVTEEDVSRLPEVEEHGYYQEMIRTRRNGVHMEVPGSRVELPEPYPHIKHLYKSAWMMEDACEVAALITESIHQGFDGWEPHEVTVIKKYLDDLGCAFQVVKETNSK